MREENREKLREKYKKFYYAHHEERKKLNRELWKKNIEKKHAYQKRIYLERIRFERADEKKERDKKKEEKLKGFLKKWKKIANKRWLIEGKNMLIKPTFRRS